MSSSVRAVIVSGEAPESEDEDRPDISSPEDVSRLSLAGLSLSSVTAQVGKQIGAMSAGNGQTKVAELTKIHHPTLLHKKLYEKNITINNNIKSFFKGLFNKSFEELSGVHSDCLTTARYIQHSAEQIESSGQTCRQIEDSLSQLRESLEKTNLPVNFK